MKPYSFLSEAERPAVQYYNQQAPQNPQANPLMNTAMGFASVFKPFNISGITIKTRNRIMAESNAKLNRVNLLTAKLQKQASDPTNKNAQTDQIKLKYAQNAYKLHHEFISKTIFWKSRVRFNMGPQFLQLKEQYTRALFTLEQAFKREMLNLNPAETQNY